MKIGLTSGLKNIWPTAEDSPEKILPEVNVAEDPKIIFQYILQLKNIYFLKLLKLMFYFIEEKEYNNIY